MTTNLKDLENRLPPLPPKISRIYSVLESGMDLDQGISPLVFNKRASLVALALRQLNLIMNALDMFKTQYQMYSAAREAQDYLTMRGMLEHGAATQTLLVMLAGAGGTGDLCNTWNPRLTLDQLRERERAQEKEFLRVATGHPPKTPYVSQGGTLSPIREAQTSIEAPSAPPSVIQQDELMRDCHTTNPTY
ncbi:uncharacterized protein VP01_1985g3 [Puccinia sorghi]|uniref:Uncharacterized protein n=1 Tax=Puccinia sorghi TaxID=27349 RepID=A0A0L6VBJ7_9BASI|nr:uncharacterized protein VP01_1985g3 [Puccinia sorghi]